MTAPQNSTSGVGCVFWTVVAMLVIGPLGTCALVGVVNWRHDKARQVVTNQAGPSAEAPVDPRVQKDGARICAAYRELARTLPDDAFQDGSVVWKKLGLSAPPDDPWGRPYAWQAWNRSVLSSGPDRSLGTPDDQTVRCEG